MSVTSRSRLSAGASGFNPSETCRALAAPSSPVPYCACRMWKPTPLPSVRSITLTVNTACACQSCGVRPDSALRSYSTSKRSCRASQLSCVGFVGSVG
ncbi:hypothetical protein G6F55_014603 [Rhizopus delemar]|nr:hypothetical protein G6F55_014603 [Rhizopus delemar]